MSMKTKAAILVTSFAVLLFVVVGSLGGVHASSNDGSYRQLQVYSEVLSRVRSEYVEEPNIPKVTDGALHGLVESLDSNSSYMTADAYKAYKAHKQEARGEIGAVVSKRFGYADVVAISADGSAAKIRWPGKQTRSPKTSRFIFKLNILSPPTWRRNISYRDEPQRQKRTRKVTARTAYLKLIREERLAVSHV